MPTLLHPQLAGDCLPVTGLGVCNVYLQNNSYFPWLVLVPMRDGISEIFELEIGDYGQVMKEVRAVTMNFANFTRADKMNVATLGNIVPQLHIHIIARFKNDAAWPNPVWNATLTPTPYSPEQAESLVKELQKVL